MTTVLVVDDDADITANIADILLDFGFQVDVANDGESALELVRYRRYDIALLDFKMPGIDGADLFKEIKALQPHVVAIMVTAYAGSDGVERAKNAGTWRVLRKPVDIAQLMSLVSEAAQQPLLLLVDDDKDFCENLSQVLRELGFRVGLATDEESARSQLQHASFNIVLLDLQLGETTSKSLFNSIVESNQVCSTIIVTGSRESNDMIDSMLESGAIAVHFKPLDVGKLIQTIKSASRS